VGDRIEKYELSRCVARGGMGSVWAAKLHGPHGFEKIVAIKTVLPELAGDARVRAMFLDEARLASAIEHRNVAHVLDFLEHEGALYIVLEWIDGIALMALHERLARLGARIPIGIALRILADVCAGLHAAHELTYANGEPCGVVHRDVSPHNVLVAGEGSAKLIDFGVAKTRLRVAPDSAFGELRGRLAFMAPEQARSDQLDRRADIWSVGASLFYVIAGHGPFGVCERTEGLRSLFMGAPPLPPPPNAHPAVASILSGCLALRREDRFPTAEHLGSAIEEAIEQMGVAGTARDVAEFLADRTHRADPRRVDSGRCAIPGDLTILRTDTVPCVRPAGRIALSPASNLGRAVAGFACVSAIGLTIGWAAGLLRMRAPPVSAPATSAPPAVVDDVPKAAAPAANTLTLPVVVLTRGDAPDDPTTRPRARPPAPRGAHQDGPKTRTAHGRLDGSP
jgi:eukaryotic-like serine/threonine-protein kinase